MKVVRIKRLHILKNQSQLHPTRWLALDFCALKPIGM
ncbi:hypothetical protein UKMH10_0546 [Burkholderia pseudomallei]|nr:hypothetical protein BPC006_I0609 [Burkholderia pseudomallei BPC006]KGX94907.1 hypothetical protein Y023_5585 [Burkholderia pseudomallei A79D]KGX95711.1 hypothetical protein X997_5370 [Burkholderia pseudomallei A79C]VUD43278.1 hypothetical protein UKMH10_0546 [Burkholderia pseudomallei]